MKHTLETREQTFERLKAEINTLTFITILMLGAFLAAQAYVQIELIELIK